MTIRLSGYVKTNPPIPNDGSRNPTGSQTSIHSGEQTLIRPNVLSSIRKAYNNIGSLAELVPPVPKEQTGRGNKVLIKDKDFISTNTMCQIRHTHKGISDEEFETQESIAEEVGVAQQTIANWINEFTNFGNVAKIGKNLANYIDNDFSPFLHDTWRCKAERGLTHFGATEGRGMNNWYGIRSRVLYKGRELFFAEYKDRIDTTRFDIPQDYEDHYFAFVLLKQLYPYLYRNASRKDGLFPVIKYEGVKLFQFRGLDQVAVQGISSHRDYPLIEQTRDLFLQLVWIEYLNLLQGKNCRSIKKSRVLTFK